MLAEMLRSSAGIEVRQHYTKENEVLLCCPFCGDSRFRLGVNVSTGRAHCFNCDWSSGSLVKTIVQLGKAFEIDIRNWRVKLLKGGQRHEAALAGEVSTAKKKAAIKKVGIKQHNTLRLTTCRRFTLRDKPLSSEASAYNYLLQRNITVEQIQRHDVRYCLVGKLRQRIVFPVLNKRKQIVGTVARSYTNRIPKYLNSTGCKTLWNAHEGAKIGIVLEGVFDALAVERAYWNDLHYRAISRLGSTLTDSQLKVLKRFDRLVFIPDLDLPGIKGIFKVMPQLQVFGFTPEVAIPSVLNGKDPGDMSPEQIRMLVSQTKPWNKNTQYRLKLLKERA